MCAMNPRLLRPKASSGFRPDSISGLANWWDANDAATLTLNSGAVETWTSKSGSKSPATQSTASSRPTTTAANGKTALLFDGVDDGLNFTGTSRTDETWILAAAQTADQSGQRQMISDGGSGTGLSATKGAAKFYEVAFGGFTEGTNRLRVQYSASASTLLGPAVLSCVRSAAGGGFAFVDGVQRTSAVGGTFPRFTTSNADTMSKIGYYSSSLFQFQGWIGEILCYSRALTAAERNAVELYLGRKWGIAVTQVPSVSNADAQDWVNRVYSNGGTVSASTASAVSAFCDAIDAASIRDRFFRLNLFCGTGLNAALVPLYRGPSRTGTQYGNLTDTNNGPFVSGDYNETGSSAGLAGAATKYLNTGVKANDLGQTDRHLSVVADASALGGSSQYSIGGDNFGGSGNYYWGILAGSTVGNMMVRAQATAANSSQFSVTGKPHVLVSGNGSAAVYRNGSSVATGPAGTFTAPAQDIWVLGLNRNGSLGDVYNGRIQSYSIGPAVTAAQASSFYTAVSAFQTSLSRA
jgi:hypothetical protein